MVKCIQKDNKVLVFDWNNDKPFISWGSFRSKPSKFSTYAKAGKVLVSGYYNLTEETELSKLTKLVISLCNTPKEWHDNRLKLRNISAKTHKDFIEANIPITQQDSFLPWEDVGTTEQVCFADISPDVLVNQISHMAIDMSKITHQWVLNFCKEVKEVQHTPYLVKYLDYQDWYFWTTLLHLNGCHVKIRDDCLYGYDGIYTNREQIKTTLNTSVNHDGIIALDGTSIVLLVCT